MKDNGSTEPLTDAIVTVEYLRSEGLLQEVNRLFFHPRGLALAVTKDKDGWHLGPIYRTSDPEGFYFAEDKDKNEERLNKAGKADYRRIWYSGARVRRWGQEIQPLPMREGKTG